MTLRVYLPFRKITTTFFLKDMLIINLECHTIIFFKRSTKLTWRKIYSMQSIITKLVESFSNGI